MTKMNSKNDKKYIVSYFCILLLLCGVRSISGICCEGSISDRMQSYNLDAKVGYPESQYYMADGTLFNGRAAARYASYRDQFPGAASVPAYSNEMAFYGFGGMILYEVIILVIITILAARHLLC